MKSFCKTVGLSLPIIQAPMHHYGNQVDLAITASENGLLGVYTTAFQSLDVIKEDLLEITEKTANPFAVVVHLDQKTDSSDFIHLSSIKEHLEPIWSDLGISNKNVAEVLPNSDHIIDLLLSEPPPVIIFQNGLPSEEILQRFKALSVHLIAIASNILEVAACNKSLIDTILLQGSETPGLKSQFSNEFNVDFYPVSTLLYHASTLSKKQLLVWGDIQTPSGLASYLLNGASAIVLDTILWTTTEANTPTIYHNLLLQNNEMTTTLSRAYTGYYERIQKNKISQIFQSIDPIILPPKQQYPLMSSIIKEAIRQENKNYIPTPAGFCSLVSSIRLSEVASYYSDTLKELINE